MIRGAAGVVAASMVPFGLKPKMIGWDVGENSFAARIVTVADWNSCGSISKASINYLTPSQLETLFQKPSIHLLADCPNANGVGPDALYDWMMRNVKS